MNIWYAYYQSFTSITGLTSLEKLTLLSNNLKLIEVGVFASTTNLRDLNIIGNPLLSLPDHLLDGLTSLESVSKIN